MDLRRLRAGEWIVALSGAALLVSLFLPWYGTGRTGRGAHLTAWQALTVNDVILSLIAVAAVATFLVTATQRVPALPIAFISLETLAALVATILVVVRVVWLPDLADTRSAGLWLGLAAAIGMTGGGWIGIRDERRSKPGKPTDATGRPAPPPPEVEAIPAPRA